MCLNSMPSAVARATNLLWASVAIGYAKAALRNGDFDMEGPLTNWASLCAFSLSALLIVMISAGRNWARLIFLVLFVAGVVRTFPGCVARFNEVPIKAALSVLLVFLQGYALYLIFDSAGSVWFQVRVKACEHNLRTGGSASSKANHSDSGQGTSMKNPPPEARSRFS